MNAMQETLGVVHKLVAVGALLLAVTFNANAQVKTETNITPGASTTTVSVERGTVVYVSGNNLVVRKDDGTLMHFNNVPDTTTVTVDGKQLNVHQLTPGMQIERQTITTATPRRITTIKTVTGTVWSVSPPNWVILRMDNNQNQRFAIPKGQKFNVNGIETDAFGLKKGMKVSAQQVTEESETVYAQEVKRTGTAPPPPPAPDPDVPMLVLLVPVRAPAPVEVASASAQAQAEPAPTALPRTASNMPLLALLGLLSIALGMGLKAVRIRQS
jgi:hypothetical protein